MNTGVQEMIAVLSEMRQEVERNECHLGDQAMRALAVALRTLYHSKMPRRLSREAASTALGVSPRHFSRLATEAGVKPHRDGFKCIYYTEDDIEAIRAYRRDK